MSEEQIPENEKGCMNCGWRFDSCGDDPRFWKCGRSGMYCDIVRTFTPADCQWKTRPEWMSDPKPEPPPVPKPTANPEWIAFLLGVVAGLIITAVMMFVAS